MDDVERLCIHLADAGRNFYRRGWVLGTSGNFSAVVHRDPAQIVITASGAHKGVLSPTQFVRVDEAEGAINGAVRPSAETKLHFSIVRLRGAGAVLHTHSTWATLLSDRYGPDGGLSIEGYEMLKGLAGVSTHEHREWLPILENSQDYVLLAGNVEETLERHVAAHGFLLRRHGLYTWGWDIAEARRHVEILEFLLEVIGGTQLKG